jgi:outer membrane protein
MHKRKTFRRISASIVFALALTGSSFAQVDDGSLVTFTLSQAVDLALRVNPEVRSERERIEEFNELVKQAKGTALPEVNANLQWRQTRDPGLRNSPFFSRIIGSGEIPPEALQAFFFANYIWNIDVSQPIYTFGRVSNAKKAASEEREGVDWDVRSVENRIAFDVVQACYRFLLARHNLEVLETERESRQRQLEQVEARFDLGDATKLDVLRARVALANLQPEILAADNDLQLAVASVNNTLGRPLDAPIDVLAELSLDDPPTVLRPEALLELAGQHRPELRRYAVDRAVLESRIGVTSSITKPELRATGGFGVNTFASSNVSDLSLHTWNVGVAFDWKLFDGFQTKSQVAVYRSQITQSRFDEQTFRNELSVELKDANGTWRRALEAFRVNMLGLEQAKEAERIAEESLQWGAATTLDVLQSTAALRQAELNQMTAAHDALVALAEMKYLVGFRADAPHEVIEAPEPVADSDADNEGSEP